MNDPGVTSAVWWTSHHTDSVKLVYIPPSPVLGHPTPSLLAGHTTTTTHNETSQVTDFDAIRNLS